MGVMDETTASRIAQLEDNLRFLATHIAMGSAGKIHAIKAYRAATGAPLKDAKDYVEAIAARAEKTVEDSRIQRVEDRLHHVERRVAFLEQFAPANEGA